MTTPRPQVHFTPPRHWMNDPNGLVRYNGLWHLYYQHNPYGNQWGHMSWGHAASEDLFHWRDLPLAMPEDSEENICRFSGSARVDEQNAGGMGEDGQPVVVAAYTAVHRGEPTTQDIHIAWSEDGLAFREMGQNPVIAIGSPKFGDPRLLRLGGRWVLVSIEGRPQGRVLFHASDDLREWEQTGEFTAPDEIPGIWECPDLFELPIAGEGTSRWVLKVNTTPARQSYYVVGIFDGMTFRAEEPPRLWDHGDVYAQQTYARSSAQDRCVQLGWIVQEPSDDRPWTGMMSVPRELTLRRTGGELRLHQCPAVELEQMRHPCCWHIYDRTIAPDGTALTGAGGRALDLSLEVDGPGAGEVELLVPLDSGDLGVGYSEDALFINPPQGDRLAAPLPPGDGRTDLRVVLDRGVVEAFARDGAAALTAAFDPPQRFGELSMRAESPAHLQVANAWPLPPTVER
jgi:fructan beta-fructosidase